MCVFNLWRSEGILGNFHLKYATGACLAGTIICLFGSYFHMHISWSRYSEGILGTIICLFGSWSRHLAVL